jgi:hypothetical protein
LNHRPFVDVCFPLVWHRPGLFCVFVTGFRVSDLHPDFPTHSHPFHALENTFIPPFRFSIVVYTANFSPVLFSQPFYSPIFETASRPVSASRKSPPFSIVTHASNQRLSATFTPIFRGERTRFFPLASLLDSSCLTCIARFNFNAPASWVSQIPFNDSGDTRYAQLAFSTSIFAGLQPLFARKFGNLASASRRVEFLRFGNPSCAISSSQFHLSNLGTSSILGSHSAIRRHNTSAKGEPTSPTIGSLFLLFLRELGSLETGSFAIFPTLLGSNPTLLLAKEELP